MKRTWAGEVRNVSLLVAIGVNGDGYREILGICEGAKEDKSGWSAFLRHLVDRGLAGVELIISDACRGRHAHGFANMSLAVSRFLLPAERWARTWELSRLSSSGTEPEAAIFSNTRCQIRREDQRL